MLKLFKQHKYVVFYSLYGIMFSGPCQTFFLPVSQLDFW